MVALVEVTVVVEDKLVVVLELGADVVEVVVVDGVVEVLVERNEALEEVESLDLTADDVDEEETKEVVVLEVVWAWASAEELVAAGKVDEEVDVSGDELADEDKGEVAVGVEGARNATEAVRAPATTISATPATMMTVWTPWETPARLLTSILTILRRATRACLDDRELLVCGIQDLGLGYPEPVFQDGGIRLPEVDVPEEVTR